MLRKILLAAPLASAEYMFHWRYSGRVDGIDCVANYDHIDLASKLPPSAFADDPTQYKKFIDVMKVWNYYKHVDGVVHEIQSDKQYEAGQPEKSEGPLIAVPYTGWGQIFHDIHSCLIPGGEGGLLGNPVPTNEAMAYYMMDDASCIKEHEQLEELSRLPKDKFTDAGEYDALVTAMNDWAFYKHVDGKIHFAWQVKKKEHIKEDIEALSKYHDKADYAKMFATIEKCMKVEPEIN